MNLKHQPWWLLAGIAVCSTAQALPEQPSQDSPAVTESASPGVKVAIDPKTGKLRAPTEEESRQLDQKAQPSAAARSARRAEPLGAGKKGFVAPGNATEAATQQRRLPAGGVAQQVPESLMTNVLIHRDANGQLVLQHADTGTVANPPRKEADDE